MQLPGTTIFPVKLADARVPVSVLAAYFAWLACLEKTDSFAVSSAAGAAMPWVPVGFVGGVMTLGHVHTETECPLPLFSAQRVRLSGNDYDRVIFEAMNRREMALASVGEYSRPKEISPAFPKMHSDNERLSFIQKNMVLEGGAAKQLQEWVGVPHFEWKEGFRETVGYFGGTPFLDVRLANCHVPQKFQDILSAHHSAFVGSPDGDEQNLVVVTSSGGRKASFRDALAQRAGHNVQIQFVLSRDDWILRFLSDGASDGKRTISTASAEVSSKFTISDEDKADCSVNVERVLDSIHPRAKEVPVGDIFDWILASAYQKGATDIHIEPMNYADGGGRVRLRIDGDGMTLLEHLQEEQMNMLFRHVKNRCKMTEETFAIQDSALSCKFTYRGNTRVVKQRVSAIPVKEGGRAQAIVLRLLNSMMAKWSNIAADLNAAERKVLEWAIERDHGVVYITGPTGSGKTTTLYALLRELNKPENVIITAEDPIEYELEGVRQSQINHARGHTFQQALKSMLRQDPDIILVGETRDAETAAMLLAAAETGHLCFTTLHTNTALGVLSRMETFGKSSGMFDRGKIISSSILFQAQRLCKKVCRSCYEHLKPTDDEKRLFEAARMPVPNYLVRGRGCPECGGRGLSGRVSIMETVPIEEGGEIYTAIEEGAPAGELRKLADKLGYKTLFGSALELAADQKIPMSEAIVHNPRIA